MQYFNLSVILIDLKNLEFKCTLSQLLPNSNLSAYLPTLCLGRETGFAIIATTLILHSEKGAIDAKHSQDNKTKKYLPTTAIHL